jgi:hypothetical protein
MTTYVLGAGASFHAGYPLCSSLWSQMAMWVIQLDPPNSAHRQAIDTIATLNGPVVDVESTFTNLDLGQGVFQALTDRQRGQLTHKIRRCLTDYFTEICSGRQESPLYAAFADAIEKGDRIITFNYDVSLENELISAEKFTIKNGYGTSFGSRLGCAKLRCDGTQTPWEHQLDCFGLRRV